MKDVFRSPEAFLPERVARPVSDNPTGTPMALFLGEGAQALEILVVRYDERPKASALRGVWEHRLNRRAVPVMVVALHDDQASLCLPMTDGSELLRDLDVEQVQRLCDAALDEPDPEAARRFLYSQVPTIQAGTDGLRNEGLFARHALNTLESPAGDADRARTIAGRKDKRLLEGLGYDLTQADNLSLLLKQGERGEALAVLLRRDERPESKNDRFNGLSPVSYAVTKGEARGLRWVLLLRGRELRLYPTANEGVSARGATETYLEVNLATLPDAMIGRLWSLFSAEALAPGGTVGRLLEDSRRYAADLAVKLRERIYTETVPQLAAAIVAARDLHDPDRRALDETYRMALLVLFRLLFIAYAEDGNLLPYRSNAAFRERSLKNKAQRLLDAHREGIEAGHHDQHWKDVQALFDAVDHGHEEWGVPAYNGGLFSKDPKVSPEGAEIARLSIPDAALVPALRSLLVAFDENDEALGPVDFRSLGVREFGTIYEGLLESELAVAQTDLITKNQAKARPSRNPKKEDLVLQPAVPGQEPEVRAGAVYLHNHSGARKSSGSYYTKPFAVNHLLDRALEPAIDAHLARVDALEDADAARALFDFRVADIAMGSGHFLVAAIDRIERRFARYLIERRDAGRPLTHVLGELDDLRAAARKALGRGADAVEIEDQALLRRLIARRCIYGVDLNDMAVMLARLAVWVHSFVPGLPLAVLDHNLACGNALVGMGSKEAIQARLDEASDDLFGRDVGQWMDRAMPALRRLQTVADATLRDVEASREALAEAKRELADLRDLCDVLVAEPLSDDVFFDADHWSKEDDLERNAMVRTACEALDGLRPFHFPVEMPEVFLRSRPGFDVMLGNPPWEKVRVENHNFWARYSSGLQGLARSDREETIEQLQRTRPDLVALLSEEERMSAHIRKVLAVFPGMGGGHPDLLRAFWHRYIMLPCASGGTIGIVLPADVMKVPGTTELRRNFFTSFANSQCAFLQNNGEWVFDDVHQQKTVVLLSGLKGVNSDGFVDVNPVAHSYSSWSKSKDCSVTVSLSEMTRKSRSFSVPIVSHSYDIEIISQMYLESMSAEQREHEFSRIYADIESSRGSQYFSSSGDWPLYKAGSFDIWEPERHVSDAFVDEYRAVEVLDRKRHRNPSAYLGLLARWFDTQETLPALHPRLAMRRTTNRTNTRTLIAALVPPKVLLSEDTPWVFVRPGDEATTSYLLGLMSSLVLDWWARRRVEGKFDAEAFADMPIPRPSRTDPLWRRTVALAGRLAAVDDRYADWAASVGVAHGPVPEGAKQDMIHELDAIAAHLYQLDRAMLIHVFETFHEGWDHQPRLDAVLAHYDAWSESPATTEPEDAA